MNNFNAIGTKGCYEFLSMSYIDFIEELLFDEIRIIDGYIEKYNSKELKDEKVRLLEKMRILTMLGE